MPFSDACFAKGVQPIIGATLGVSAPGRRAGGAGAIDWLVLLAQDEAGLCQSVQAGVGGAPRPPARATSRMSPSTLLEGQSDGLIALTAGGEGALARLIADGQTDKAKAYLDRLAGAVRRAALHRARAPRRPGRAGRRRRADRACLCARPSARRDQSRVHIPSPSFPRRARRDAVHRQFGLCRKRRPADLARPKPGSRPARRWPSCSPTFPRRSPIPRSSPSAARSRRRSAIRSFRASATTRTSSCAAMRGRG